MEFKRQPINDCDIIVLFVLQLADTRLMRAAARTSAYWFMRGKEKCEYTLFSSILKYTLKLVFLAWSKSKSDCEIGFSMLKNLSVNLNFFLASGV